MWKVSDIIIIDLTIATVARQHLLNVIIGLLHWLFLNFCCLVTVAKVVRLICNRTNGHGIQD